VQEGTPRVVPLDRGRLPRLARSGLDTARQQIADADVIHLHVPWDPICRQLGQLAQRAGVPYVVSLHGMLDDWCMLQKRLKKRAYLAMGGRRFLTQAAAVLCTAGGERDQSSKWYPKGRAEIVPYIVDTSPFVELPGPALARESFPELFAATDRPLVLFLSRLHEKKGLEKLIEAAAILRDRGVDVNVAIAGTGKPGYVQSLEQLGRRLGVDDRLFFIGFVGGARKLSLYEAADVFVLPTSQENWGLVLTESLGCGTPVITTRGTDIWPELEASGGAVIVDMTAQATAEAIAQLVADRQRIDSMGEKGRAWVLENLTVDRVLDQYEQLYTQASA
jgi:glycosyltransferase involved in cell wall biosynthesis